MLYEGTESGGMSGNIYSCKEEFRENVGQAQVIDNLFFCSHRDAFMYPPQTPSIFN